MARPIVVEVRRGTCVETLHRVVAAVVDHQGVVRATFGARTARYPARSTVKLLQVLPLLRSGAASQHAVSDEELALACGSHRGEPGHLETVANWLRRLDLNGTSLRCAAEVPEGLPAETAPSRLAHNCSGKHTGWLTLARHLGAPVERYLDSEGPVQRLVLDTLAQACGVRLSADRVVIDGCSAPAPCLTMTELARGTATLLAVDAGAAERRVLNTMERHPWFVGGTGRFDTRLIEHTEGRTLSKVGADGVHVALLRDQGLAVAVKATDGSSRASEAGLTHLLVELDGLAPEAAAELCDQTVRDDEGQPVGNVVVRPLSSRTA